MSRASKISWRLWAVFLMLAFVGVPCDASADPQAETATVQLQNLLDTVEPTDVLNVDKIQQWIEAGADVNIVDKKYGRTLLRVAAFSGSAEVVKLLLAAGADVSITDSDWGASPLVAASQNGHAKVVKLLLSAKADVNAAEKTNNLTALWLSLTKWSPGDCQVTTCRKGRSKCDRKATQYHPALCGIAEWPYRSGEAAPECGCNREYG